MTTPRRFRKKPVEIEAMQYDGAVGRATEIIDWALANDGTITYHCPDDGSCNRDSHVLSIRTLEGTMTALPGDWIIRGVQGEFYPCKPDIFEQTYDEVREATPDDVKAWAAGYRESDGTADTRDHNRFTARDKHPAAEHAYMVGWSDGHSEATYEPAVEQVDHGGWEDH